MTDWKGGREMRDIFGVIQIFYSVIGLLVTQVNTIVKIHKTVQLRSMHFTVFKLYLN